RHQRILAGGDARSAGLRIEPLGQRACARISRPRRAQPDGFGRLPIEPGLSGPDAAAAFIVGVAGREMEIYASAAADAAEDRHDRLDEHLPDVIFAADRALAVRVAAVEERPIANECRHAADRYPFGGVDEAAENTETRKLVGIRCGTGRDRINHP